MLNIYLLLFHLRDDAPRVPPRALPDRGIGRDLVPSLTTTKRGPLSAVVVVSAEICRTDEGSVMSCTGTSGRVQARCVPVKLSSFPRGRAVECRHLVGTCAPIPLFLNKRVAIESGRHDETAEWIIQRERRAGVSQREWDGDEVRKGPCLKETPTR